MNNVQALVDALAAHLGRPVGVDDRRFRAVAYSAHTNDIDDVRRRSILGREAPQEVSAWLRSVGIDVADQPVRVPRNESLGMTARVCVPVRYDGALFGYLWLLDDPVPLNEPAIESSVRYAGELAEELFRLRRLEGEERRREAELVRALVSGTTSGSGVPARWPDVGLATASNYACLVLRESSGRRDPAAGPTAPMWLAATVDAARRGCAPHHLLGAVADEEAVVLLAYDGRGELQRRTEALCGLAEGTSGTRQEFVIGVSAPSAEVSGLPQAYREARRAAYIATAVDRFRPVCYWARLGAYRTVGMLVGDARAADFVPESFTRLLLATADAAALVETVEAYLEHGGDVQATAMELHLHRSTVYNRLHRIQDIADVDLSRGDDRLELHLGLRLWRLGAGAL